MPTSTQIRQTFLDFFREKQHTIVPSSSLLPDSPNLLFTNAGMNQFVPIFLGEKKADVSKWGGAIPGSDTRAADTQKCIRAGGKHNDLDDVGLDTYHHTFFEMLGNWSFGDYFKKEAIAWSWELIVERFKFPPNRVYASIYQPDPGDPSERDQEAYDLWAEKFTSVGLDPAVHIVNGNKKDNFWMMGETGPCGPCSEIHIDLTPEDRTLELEKRGAKLVNSGVPECIEIWNNVFIQFNANPDGTFTPLPAQHVDTGMGFERLTSIIQGTKEFADFKNAKISNYETDIFRPIFDELEKMSGYTYRSTLPATSSSSPGAIISQAGVPTSDSGAPVKISPLPNSDSGDLDNVSGAQNRTAGAPVSDSAAQNKTAEPQITVSGIPGSAFGSVAKEQPAAFCAEQIAIDVAFRVIADHIRTLSFAIADGIQPGNTDRTYVLRRILRRAVRYGRTLGFREPFFYKLVAVLAREMGEVFPEIRAKQKHVEETLKREEEAFNKTLDRGIGLFEAEVARLAGPAAGVGPVAGVGSAVGLGPVAGASGRVGVPPAGSGILPERTSERDSGATYTRRRRLPHFEQPWALYALTFTTTGQRKLTPAARTMVLDALRHFHRSRYEMFAACIMPDHVHILLQPWVKEQNDRGEAVFWPLSDLMHSIKSFTAKEINKAEGATGAVWEQERFDRYVRGDRDLEEKFRYILDNPAREGLGDEYPWVWTVNDVPQDRSGETPEPAGGTPTLPGSFAFTLYDTYGFPLDLTELMARERGLTVDTAGFEKHMDEQRARARAAQKKQVIELSEIETKTPTHFLGYEHDHTGADVQEVLSVKGRTAIITNNSVCYAEMGGQVGDTGEMTHGGHSWRIANTQKSGATWLHFLDEEGAAAPGRAGVPPAGSGVSPERSFATGDAFPIVGKAATQDATLGGQDAHPTRDADAPLPSAPLPGEQVTITLDRARRGAIQRHHTVTHLLHWALHEVVSHEATQKGSFVGPDKLTFDFNSAALTPAQVRDIERLVNERIVENAAVSWIEVPYADVRGRADIMQFFGDKYGETVRVVQIGGASHSLDGYSMELCAGTHTRATGEIGLFTIKGEGAIAAGVRRIEAVAGLNAYDAATADSQRLHALAAQLGAPLADLEKRIESTLAQQKELERTLKTAIARNAAQTASWLLGRVAEVNGIPLITQNFPDADGEYLQAVVDALKSRTFKGAIVLGASANGAVSLVANVSPDFTAKVQAGKIISAIAPLVGGKGGGKPDNARGGGKDPSQLDAALAKAKELLA